MKKFLKTLFAVVLVIPMFFMAACGDKPETPNGGNNSTPNTEQSTPTPAPTPAPVTSTTYNFVSISDERLDGEAVSGPYCGGKIIVYSDNSVEVELLSNESYNTSTTKVKGTFSTTDDKINMTLTEPATEDLQTFGQFAYTASMSTEEATESLLSIVDLEFANNKNYIVVTAMKMIPMVFVKEGYTPSEKEFITTASILNAMGLDNQTHSTYFNFYVALGGVYTITNENGTLYYNSIDPARISKFDGVSFDNSGYLVAGTYSDAKIYVDENATTTATTEDDTIYSIKEFSVRPVSNVKLYSFDGTNYTEIDKATSTKGKTVEQFIEDFKPYYSLDDGATHNPITAQMISGYDSSKVTQIESFPDFITITIPVVDSDPITHSVDFIVRGEGISEISIERVGGGTVDFFSMPKNTDIETFLTDFSVVIEYADKSRTNLEFTDSKITVGSVDTSTPGYTKVDFSYTEDEVVYSASYIVAVTDETHNAPYRYVIKTGADSYTNYYHYSLDLTSDPNKESSATALNNMTLEIYAEYFDGTYSATPVATLDFNELCGIETITSSNVEMFVGSNPFEYSAELDVVGEGFESFKYTSTVTLNVYGIPASN